MSRVAAAAVQTIGDPLPSRLDQVNLFWQRYEKLAEEYDRDIFRRYNDRLHDVIETGRAHIFEQPMAELPEIPAQFGQDGGKFYHYYDQLAEELDEDLTKRLKSQLDSLLIFVQ